MLILEHIGERIRGALDAMHLEWMAAATRPAYHHLLRLLYPAGIPRYIHGEPALYFSPEARCVPEGADEGSFCVMKERIREGAVVLDLGANIGIYSMVMARWAGPSGRVFAFEPAEQTAAKLQRHINMNHLADRVEAIQTAVGDAVGEVAFYYSAALPAHSSVAASAIRGSQPRIVPVTTVDAFCMSRGIVPTFLKIDVEGYEAHVLDGARETIRQHTPDLLMETHPHHWQELGLSREQVEGRLAKLTDCGYRSKNLDGDVNPLEKAGHLLCWHPARWTS